MSALKSLSQCTDASTLVCALQTLCAQFGELTRIKVVTLSEAEKRRALCLLRLESIEQEQKLMSSLGMSRFGEDVVVVVDLNSAPA
jgi:hypothetical protein